MKNGKAYLSPIRVDRSIQQVTPPTHMDCVERLKFWKIPQGLAGEKSQSESTDDTDKEKVTQCPVSCVDVTDMQNHSGQQSTIQRQIASDGPVSLKSDTVTAEDEGMGALPSSQPLLHTSVSPVSWPLSQHPSVPEGVAVSRVTSDDSTKEQQLMDYFDQVHRDRAEKVLVKILQVMQSSYSLGWLTDLPYKPIHICLHDLPGNIREECDIEVYLRANGKANFEWLRLGDSGDSAALVKLLASNWPKAIKIVLSIDKASAELENPARIAWIMAHQIGVHLAPYWELLEKALIRNRLSAADQKKLIEYFSDNNKTHIDHCALHRGYLCPNWQRSSRAKPQYRLLISALCRAHFKGADAKFLWKKYCQDIAAFHVLSGKRLLSTETVKRQYRFYQAYEAYKNHTRAHYPLLEKIGVFRKALLVVACTSLLSVLFFIRSDFISLVYSALQ